MIITITIVFSHEWLPGCRKLPSLSQLSANGDFCGSCLAWGCSEADQVEWQPGLGACTVGTLEGEGSALGDLEAKVRIGGLSRPSGS